MIHVYASLRESIPFVLGIIIGWWCRGLGRHHAEG